MWLSRGKVTTELFRGQNRKYLRMTIVFIVTDAKQFPVTV